MRHIIKTLLALIFIITALYLSSTQTSALVTGTVSPESVNEATPHVTITFPGLDANQEYFFCLKNGGDCVFDNTDFLVSVTTNSNGVASITICGQGEGFVKACEADDFFHQTNYHLGIFENSDGTGVAGEVNFNVGPAQCPADYEYIPNFNDCGREVDGENDCTSEETYHSVDLGGVDRHFCTLEFDPPNPFDPVDPSTPGEINIPPARLPGGPTVGFDAENLIGQLVSRILPIILGIAGFIAVIIIVISGIQFIVSSGNPEAAAAARSRLIFAVVGFAIIILAFALTQIVDRIFLGGSGVL